MSLTLPDDSEVMRIYKMQKISNVLRDIYERGRVQHVNVTYAACFKWILTNNCILHVYVCTISNF